MNNGSTKVPKPKPWELSDSQLSILRLAALGYDEPDMAGQLHLSKTTLHRQYQRLLDGLHAYTAAQAVAIGIKRGLINLDELEVA